VDLSAGVKIGPPYLKCPVCGVPIPHISPHLKGKLPDGGYIAYKDGHVQWRRFIEMSQRAIGGSGFWW